MVLEAVATDDGRSGHVTTALLLVLGGVLLKAHVVVASVMVLVVVLDDYAGASGCHGAVDSSRCSYAAAIDHEAGRVDEATAVTRVVRHHRCVVVVEARSSGHVDRMMLWQSGELLGARDRLGHGEGLLEHHLLLLHADQGVQVRALLELLLLMLEL